LHFFVDPGTAISTSCSIKAARGEAFPALKAADMGFMSTACAYKNEKANEMSKTVRFIFPPF
jgi:hypothetical protein